MLTKPCSFSITSKLEELAAEVQTIKEAVAPRPIHSVNPQLPSPLGPPGPLVHPSHLPNPNLASQPLGDTSFLPAPPPPSLFSRSRTFGLVPPTETPALTPAQASFDAASIGSGRIAEPRALGSRVFSGEDINYYFEKYVSVLITKNTTYSPTPDTLSTFTHISPLSAREIPTHATREAPSSFGPLS
jgi:hypothetical protein